ncbi:hypothetical protein ABE65_013380 [Fictibacillus phosphorivorans]|uniref:DUF309 domain-containing protein n=1 Tax=Fictibacillus phosphorivorans TaxID=1221500 RepID=A0A160INV6_9BACL|nr:DUF309 domain-containing protein [Fictibacillus phosphorivorans]ANC77736.1 hypothetical protein ABE65_013380 [Fictibacillus phosphorivorans]
MTYPKPWIQYLVYFHRDQDYFECHEVLEDHWKDEGMKGDLWPGLIQLAVAQYHHRRGNYNGARRMILSCKVKLQKEESALKELGIEVEPFLELLDRSVQRIERQQPFESIGLPLSSELFQACLTEANATEETWVLQTKTDDTIIHKHSLRDRSSVIEERKKQKQKKNRIL